MKFPP